jgi:hypothetical protein
MEQLTFPGESHAWHRNASAAVYWLFFAGIATASGIAREIWLVSRVGTLRAHQAGTLFVCAAFLAVIAVFVRHTRPSPREALAIGACWVAAALVFEVGVAIYIDQLSWRQLLADYDLTQGRLVLLLWLTLGLGPLLLTQLQRRE